MLTWISAGSINMETGSEHLLHLSPFNPPPPNISTFRCWLRLQQTCLNRALHISPVGDSVAGQSQSCRTRILFSFVKTSLPCAHIKLMNANCTSAEDNVGHWVAERKQVRQMSMCSLNDSLVTFLVWMHNLHTELSGFHQNC